MTPAEAWVWVRRNGWAWVRRSRKALVGAGVAGLGYYIGVRGDGVTLEEWWAAVLAALAGGGFTYLVPNDADVEQRRQEGEAPTAPGDAAV